MYVDSSHQLWEELNERFGQSNGLLLYQIEKDISQVSQGNDSLAIHYTKLKRMWDEFHALCEIPSCTCGAMKKITEYEEQQRLMKFLMNLHDGFDVVRSQVLLMDPLPTVGRA